VSTRQTGNRRENRCGELLRSQYGYEPFYSRGSRGTDLLAIKRDGCGPHLEISVIRPSGGSVRQQFLKLRSYVAIAGSIRVVAKERARNVWRWYWDEDHGTDELDDLLSENDGK
jgi:hypothetical protein